MSVSLYDISIPTFRRGLQNLASFLDKAEAHAGASGADLGTYTAARLAPDMHPFTRQVQMASDAAKGGAARLAGVEAPKMEDVETTFPELHQRIAKTIAVFEPVTMLVRPEDRKLAAKLCGEKVELVETALDRAVPQQ